MKNMQTSQNSPEMPNNFNNNNSVGEVLEEKNNQPEVNIGELSDIETQILGMKKINEALFETIVYMKKNEVSQEQEILNSRSFNRLLRNSSQLMQAHEVLLSSYEEIKKEKQEIETQKHQEINTIQSNHLQRLQEFQNQLQTLETQMKLSEIEKEGLLREINKYKSSDTAILENTIQDLKQTIESLEKENKELKEDYNKLILRNCEGLEIEGNQKLNSKYAVILQMIKEKTILSDRLIALRLEYDTLANSILQNSGENNANVNSEKVSSTMSKQITQLKEELETEKSQVSDSYSEMEAIFQVNQDLESKNKVLASKVEFSNKRIEMLMDEIFKKSRINEDTKKELTQVENTLKIKEDLIEKLHEKIKVINEKLDIELQHMTLLKQKETSKDELIKQYESDIDEFKKKENESKQKIKEADSYMSKVYDDLQDRLFKMSVHYLKTGKIHDPSVFNAEDGTTQPLEEIDIAILELNKYKKMVKCPK